MKLSIKVTFCLAAIVGGIGVLMLLTPPNEGGGLLLAIGAGLAIVGGIMYLTDRIGK